LNQHNCCCVTDDGGQRFGYSFLVDGFVDADNVVVVPGCFGWVTGHWMESESVHVMCTLNHTFVRAKEMLSMDLTVECNALQSSRETMLSIVVLGTYVSFDSFIVGPRNNRQSHIKSSIQDEGIERANSTCRELACYCASTARGEKLTPQHHRGTHQPFQTFLSNSLLNLDDEYLTEDCSMSVEDVMLMIYSMSGL